MAVGVRGELHDPLIDPSFQSVTHARTLAWTPQQRGYPGLRLRTPVFERETHASVILRAFSDRLRVELE